MNITKYDGFSTVILVLSLLGGGCNNDGNGNNTPTPQINDACANQDECPTGAKCVESICRALCLAPDQCDQGFGCRDGVCQKCTADEQCKNNLACDTDNGICLARCERNDQCQDGFYCTDGGTCAEKLGLGANATRADQCASGFLVDGVCCDTACDTDCFSCNVSTEKAGTCSAMDASSEGTVDGNCQGGNTFCTNIPGQYAEGNYCGAGSCQERVKKMCPGNLICAEDACLEKCTSNSDCLNDTVCDLEDNNSTTFGQCIGKLTKGQQCDELHACAAGLTCLDGVCCTSDSCGECQACNVAGAEGECANVTTGLFDDTCPDKSGCSGDKVVKYACNGNGSCSQVVSENSCGAYTCKDGACQNNCVVNSTGALSPQQLELASKSYCGGDYFCSQDTMKVDGNKKVGSCVPKLVNGQNCVALMAFQCQSGIVADNVCCDTECADTCQACDGKNTSKPSGTCANLHPGIRDANARSSCYGIACTWEGDMAGLSYNIYDVCDGIGNCLKFASNPASMGFDINSDIYTWEIAEYIDNNFPSGKNKTSIISGAIKECNNNEWCNTINTIGYVCDPN